MTKINVVYDSMDAPNTGGTSLKGKLPHGITYQDLVKALGEPTFLPEDSGDGKVNFEWVVKFENEFGEVKLFTIYDWKTPSPEWSKENTGTMEQNKEWHGGSQWHVGSKDYAGHFIEFLHNTILGE